MNSLEAIREHIQNLLELKGERGDVSDTEPLLPAGLIDSLDVVQTVLFLEENFGVYFSVQPFNQDDFESIESIHRLVDPEGSG